MPEKGNKKLVIIGAGAAGFFAAINAAEKDPELHVIILEKSNKTLSKVRISGGGRCNVTHACFDPSILATFYPRGEKELLGPFHHFQPGDTFDWFESRNVPLKIEEDGRVFPASNQSSSITACFEKSAEQAGVSVRLQSGLKRIHPPENYGGQWTLELENAGEITCDYLLIACGSSQSMWDIIKRDTGHTIIEPVPSLFTFNINSVILKHIPGLSVQNATLRIPQIDLSESGPVLITHWGLSGPAILRTSAWGARKLKELNYNFEIEINWVDLEREDVLQKISEYRTTIGKKAILSQSYFNLPLNLWKALCNACVRTEKWADINRQEMELLADAMVSCRFEVLGKSTFKDEFVTAGGVDLKEINWKKMESKLHPNLFFAGEVLDIDAITGGFNFQAAWTTAWIASESISK
jgi:predicted Rossmann fold flavoprotein